MSIRNRSTLKSSSLSKENERLSKEIRKMESVLEKHRHILDVEEDSLRGIIRKEVGGSRWTTGAKGQLSGYKTSKTLGKHPAKTESRKTLKTQENNPRNQTSISTSTKEGNQRIQPSKVNKRDLPSRHGLHPGPTKPEVNKRDLPSRQGLHPGPATKPEGRTIEGLSAQGIGMSKSSSQAITDARVSPKDSDHDAEEDVLSASYSDRISAMKAKVLAKASAKVKTQGKSNDPTPRSDRSEQEMTISTADGADAEIDICDNLEDVQTRGSIHIHVPVPETLSSVDSSESETSSSLSPEAVSEDSDDKQNDANIHVAEDVSETRQKVDVFNNDNLSLKLECKIHDEGNSSSLGSVSDEEEETTPETLPRYSNWEDETSKANAPLRLNNEPNILTKKPLRHKDPVLHDPALSVWMYGLKLVDTEQYIRVLVENDVTMGRLKWLNEHMLREMGISESVPLSRIVHGIKVLRGEVVEDKTNTLKRESHWREANHADKTNVIKQSNLQAKSKEYDNFARRVKKDASAQPVDIIVGMTCSKKMDVGRVRSAESTRAGKTEKKLIKSRPVSANVTQRSLASGVHAASHKLRKKQELQEKEKQQKEKMTKKKKVPTATLR